MIENVAEWWSKLFPNVPKRISDYMNVVETESQGVHLPWNRAQRRRHAQAKAIAIHLYAGEASKDWGKDWPPGVEIITLDVRDGQKFMALQAGSRIWDLAGSGRVIGVIGGPPCRTVSRMLETRPGPPRLRSRSDDERFGFSHLTESQQQKTDSDTALFLKQSDGGSRGVWAYRTMAGAQRTLWIYLHTSRQCYGDFQLGPQRGSLLFEKGRRRELVEDPQKEF